MISHPMIQFGKIAEVMFQLFSHLDYGWSCLVKSPNGSVRLEFFPDVSCLGMELQKSSEEGYKTDYPTDKGCIHPDYCQALHNLLSMYYEDVLGVKGASGVSVPRHLNLNFVAVSEQRPLKLRSSDPPSRLPPAQEAPESVAARVAAPATATSPKAGKADSGSTSGK